MTPFAPRLCYITDRHGLGPRPLLALVVEAIEAGVDLIQIREKDLATQDLLRLVQAAAETAQQAIARGHRTRVVVNDRLDIALAGGAHGVHLGGNSMPAGAVRAVLAAWHDAMFLIGVSCHSVAEVSAAAQGGASYALLGPIFETPSKVAYGPPLGLQPLERAARENRIPVLALGGITVGRVKLCFQAG